MITEEAPQLHELALVEKQLRIVRDGDAGEIIAGLRLKHAADTRALIDAMEAVLNPPAAVEAPVVVPIAKVRRPTVPAAPVKKRGNTRPGAVNVLSSYTLTGGWFKMSNGFSDELLAVMSGPVVKAYVLAHRLANIKGTFWCSYDGLAKRIGCHDARHGRRVMDRLRDAGLVRLIERGGPAGGKANIYQLQELDSLDLAGVKATLSKPLDGQAASRRQRSRERELVGAAHATK